MPCGQRATSNVELLTILEIAAWALPRTQAERDARMLEPRSGSRLKQKISGCFRSVQGLTILRLSERSSEPPRREAGALSRVSSEAHTI